MARWTAAEIPPLNGRRALVTGANSGLGFQTALELARHGASVVMASRDRGRGEQALSQLRALVPAAEASLMLLDLADLSSVQRCAEAYAVDHDGLDLLVNNAGVMAIPRRKTADGFEMQFGTNHLGHFALTGRLLPLLAARPGARVVTVSSNGHRMGRIDFDDLQHERDYRPWGVYGQSKLANLLFAFELQRRADAAGLPLISVAAHPGFAATNLIASGPLRTTNSVGRAVMGVVERVIAQPDTQGVLPQLYAATAPNVTGGTYVGPDGFAGQRGYPRQVGSSQRARDEEVARRLWEVSEQLTGVHYDLLDRVANPARG